MTLAWLWILWSASAEVPGHVRLAERCATGKSAACETLAFKMRQEWAQSVVMAYEEPSSRDALVVAMGRLQQADRVAAEACRQGRVTACIEQEMWAEACALGVDAACGWALTLDESRAHSHRLCLQGDPRACTEVPAGWQDFARVELLHERSSGLAGGAVVAHPEGVVVGTGKTWRPDGVEQLVLNVFSADGRHEVPLIAGQGEGRVFAVDGGVVVQLEEPDPERYAADRARSPGAVRYLWVDEQTTLHVAQAPIHLRFRHITWNLDGLGVVPGQDHRDEARPQQLVWVDGPTGRTALSGIVYGTEAAVFLNRDWLVVSTRKQGLTRARIDTTSWPPTLSEPQYRPWAQVLQLAEDGRVLMDDGSGTVIWDGKNEEPVSSARSVSPDLVWGMVSVGKYRQDLVRLKDGVSRQVSNLLCGPMSWAPDGRSFAATCNGAGWRISIDDGGGLASPPAWAASRQPLSPHVSVPPAPAPGRPLCGRMLVDGAPVRGATLTLTPEVPDIYQTEGTERVVTGRDGRFRAARPLDANYALRRAGDGLQAREHRIDRQRPMDCESATYDVTHLDLETTDDEGARVAGARVWLHGNDLPMGNTDAKGGWTVRLPTNTSAVRWTAHHPDHGWGTGWCQDAATRPAKTCTLPIGNTQPSTVRVVDEAGVPISGVVVVEVGMHPVGTTNDDGELEFGFDPDWVSGRLRLMFDDRAVRPGREELANGVRILTHEERRTTVFRRGAISRAVVVVADEVHQAYPVNEDLAFDRLPAGGHTLFALRESHLWAATVSTDGSSARVEPAWQRLPWHKIRAVDADGAPVAGLPVTTSVHTLLLTDDTDVRGELEVPVVDTRVALRVVDEPGEYSDDLEVEAESTRALPDTVLVDPTWPDTTVDVYRLQRYGEPSEGRDQKAWTEHVAAVEHLAKELGLTAAEPEPWWPRPSRRPVRTASLAGTWVSIDPTYERYRSLIEQLAEQLQDESVVERIDVSRVAYGLRAPLKRMLAEPGLSRRLLEVAHPYATITIDPARTDTFGARIRLWDDPRLTVVPLVPELLVVEREGSVWLARRAP